MPVIGSYYEALLRVSKERVSMQGTTSPCWNKGRHRCTTIGPAGLNFSDSRRLLLRTCDMVTRRVMLFSTLFGQIVFMWQIVSLYSVFHPFRPSYRWVVLVRFFCQLGGHGWCKPRSRNNVKYLKYLLTRCGVDISAYFRTCSFGDKLIREKDRLGCGHGELAKIVHQFSVYARL